MNNVESLRAISHPFWPVNWPPPVNLTGLETCFSAAHIFVFVFILLL